MRSQVPLLDRVMYYIVQRKGKQVRPMFVLLSARLHGEIGESTYTAASLIELLHTATLVHDDVVDDALERRGFFCQRLMEEQDRRTCGRLPSGERFTPVSRPQRTSHVTDHFQCREGNE